MRIHHEGTEPRGENPSPRTPINSESFRERGTEAHNAQNLTSTAEYHLRIRRRDVSPNGSVGAGHETVALVVG
jgi:hypothetical protein